MGEVFLAKDSRLRRQVARKFLPENLAADKEPLRRLGRERSGNQPADDGQKMSVAVKTSGAEFEYSTPTALFGARMPGRASSRI